MLDGVEPSVTDVVVARVRATDGAHHAIVKLARSKQGARSLRTAAASLTALRADPRADGWEVSLPEILDVSELDGFPYVVESALSGVSAARVLRQGADWQPIAALATDAIEGLHRRTRARMRVDAQLLGRWIDRPADAIRPLVAGRREAALRALEQEFRSRLDGAIVSAGWIHGDFVPENVLVDPDAGSITGIVDWELADRPNLPAIDRAMFLLAARSQTARAELGDVVAAVAKGEAGNALRSSLDAALADLGDLLDARTLALFCWLRHVAAVVTQSGRYSRHPVWKRYNVYHVLDALARE